MPLSFVLRVRASGMRAMAVVKQTSDQMIGVASAEQQMAIILLTIGLLSGSR